MLNYISQNERELKHISFLRRIFIQKMTGILHIRYAANNVTTLSFHKGNFVGDKNEVTTILSQYLSNYVPQFAWTPESIETKCGSIVSWIALTDALKVVEIKNNRAHIYCNAFSRLPPMTLKNCPVHRMNFIDESAYLLLYHLSLGVKSFEPKLFFSDIFSENERIKHIRTMLLVFLLGYLKPAPKDDQSKGKTSLASRILNRFRMGGA